MDQKIERLARKRYCANRGELVTGRYPPRWENATEEIRNWMRDEVRKELYLVSNYVSSMDSR